MENEALRFFVRTCFTLFIKLMLTQIIVYVV